MTPKATKQTKPTKTPAAKKATRAFVTTGSRDATGHELLGRAERIVQIALGRGADEAECYIQSGASVEVELEAGRIANTAASQGQGAGLRIVKKGRVGFAYLTRDEDAVMAAEQALQQSRHAPKLRFHLPDGRQAAALEGRWDDAIAALDVGTAIELAQGLLREAKEVAPKATLSGGGASLSAGWMAIASSQGVAVWDASTSVGCSASLTLKDGKRAISASDMQSLHTLDLNPADVTRKAGETVMSLRQPKAPGESRKCQVLFHPEAGTELVAGMAISAATGDDARRGKTMWSDKLNQPVAARHFSLVDDSFVPGAIGGAPFDDEGVPTSRLPIIENGVLSNFLYDSWDAHRHKAKSTASASRSGFKSRPDTGTHHLVMTSTKAQSLSKLLASIDDGFVVESVLGAHTANPTTGDFSVTAPNVWRVSKGKIVGPVTEIAIAGSLTSLLNGLEGVSKETKAMEGARMPSLLVRDVSISS